MKLNIIILIGLVAICSSHVYFHEDFTDPNWEKRWVVSDWKKDSGESGSWSLTAGKYFGNEKEERGLKTMEDARFYDISAVHEEFSNKGKTLVIQFSIKHEQNIDCGGGYIKLIPADALKDQKDFKGGPEETKYNIMFGPDICGYGTRKVHFILNKRGANNLIREDIPCETDELTHSYTAVLSPDNTFKVYVDGEEKKSGVISEHWDILPPKKINDPSQSKPKDWIDDKLMDDPEDKKPEGWDDIPAEITDPDASKPDDWDDELDGEWEAPKVSNPEYKGAWSPKKIDHPDYKGPWVHPQIDNPEYKDDPELYAFESFKYLGIDIWQVKAGSIFSNFLLTDDWETAKTHIDEINEVREVEKKKKEEAEEKEKAEREAKEAEEKLKEVPSDEADDDGIPVQEPADEADDDGRAPEEKEDL